MELKEVQIKNYRSIEVATVSFEPKCRILVGKNEAGKSNILSACALLDPSRKVSPADLRETRDEESVPVTEGHVRFVFRLSLDDLSQLQESVSSGIIGKDHFLLERNGKKTTIKDFVLRFDEVLYVIELPAGSRRYSYWSQSKVGQKLVSGWLSPKDALPADTQITANDEQTYDVSSLFLVHESEIKQEDLALFEPATIQSVQAGIARKLYALAKKQLPVCVAWRYSEETLLPQNIELDNFSEDPYICEPLRAMFLLAGVPEPGSAINLAKQKPNGLRNLLTRVARKTTDHIREKWPELGSIQVVLSPNGSVIEAAVREEYNEFSFSRRSDGFKRFVSFLILISARAISGDFAKILFIQDEPDLGLHPSGVKCLLKELVQLSKDHCVLVSTHSIFMIDRDKVDRHLIVKKEGERTSLAAVDSSRLIDEEVLFNALGYSVFEIIKPINLIFEGWRDKKLFVAALVKRLPQVQFLKKRLSIDLGMTHAMGVKDIKNVASHLELMGRKSISISDSDEPAVEAQKRFDVDENSHKWFRYDQLCPDEWRQTAEDFIKPFVLKEALAKVLAQNAVVFDSEKFSFEERAIPAVRIAKEVVANSGVGTEKQKELINIWKSRIFDSLEGEDIDDAYANVLESIARIVGMNEGADSH